MLDFNSVLWYNEPNDPAVCRKKKGETTMKKILSVLLCAVMIGAMLCMSVSAANELAKSYDDAKAGELLYDVVFGAKEGAYISDVISKAKECTVETSDGGKTLTLTHESAAKGRFWYGGEIAGLEIGEGKSYTLKGKVQIFGTNAGVYINYPNDGATYENLYGFYGGRQDNNDMSLGKGGGKATGSVKKDDGSLLCDGSAYAKYDFKAAQEANADGFAEFMIVVDGYDFAVYFNNVLFDKHIGTAEEFAKSNKFGIAFYVYNKNSGIIAKDFQVFKGDLTALSTETEAPATQPETPTTDAPVTDAPTTDAPTTEPTSPVTGDNTAVILLVIAIVAMLGTAVTVKAVREK